MRFTQASLQNLIQAIYLAEHIKRDILLKQSGNNWIGLCPFHTDSTPSLYVYPYNYHCFACQAHGSIINYEMHKTGLSFYEVCINLAQMYNIQLNLEKVYGEVAPPKLAQTATAQIVLPKLEIKEHKDRQRVQADIQHISKLKELMLKVTDIYHQSLLKAPIALSYLQNRGLSIKQINKWRLGYCLHNDILLNAAYKDSKLQHNLELLGIIKEKKNAHGHYNFFYDRIIIPIANHYGEIVAFTGRILTDKPNIAKYINSPESEIFSKSKILFNFYDALPAIIMQQFVIVVEGHMDCISLVNSGIENVVASMGTALTPFHLAALAKVTKRIILCFDNDKAGQQAAKRSLNAAADIENIDLEYGNLPDCKDPDEYIKCFGAQQLLKTLKEQNYFLYEKICAWCLEQSKDLSELINNLQKEFACLISAKNKILKNQIVQYVMQTFNINLNNYFKTKILTAVGHKEQHYLENSSENIVEKWYIKNIAEVKLLLCLVFMKFADLPIKLQHVIIGDLEKRDNETIICAQAIAQQFSQHGFNILLEICVWLLKNPNNSIYSSKLQINENFSPACKILIGFGLADIKMLLAFNLQELLRTNLSRNTSMLLSQDVWRVENANFLKFILHNINLSFKNGLLCNFFQETLLTIELSYIDHKLQEIANNHFDSDLPPELEYWTFERNRLQKYLSEIRSI